MIDGIQAYGITTPSGSATSGSNQLSMNDFLSLMVAQLSNQDMYNTVDDAQFMTQMAQFSMTQAMTDLSKITTAAYQISTAAYSVNLIGKEATIIETNSEGATLFQKGTIEGVNLLRDSAEVIMNGRTYPITSVVSVRDPKIQTPEVPEVTEAAVEEIAEVEEITEPEAITEAEEGEDTGV
ncbi:MAG: flagellar hook capping FlgD N-terminal domain-containing protein [Eubacteriales bacterium]|nr:flagellar hook capping FlgD N-terminal domain-containing protein [Eubacteriales bacterium]MDD3289455.1 flagellar hook capping FlgD N-terminal domain-containing protein [Eubacteriales bacterium]MDD3863241.1 flagellar hook capping FlgD N-terminal domain-containing protein [Eubacteriales bacterium]MDD4444361.1 flagellar hook capping FlgD N-terminal domain-containing protein [Eubacteriales bacterium]